jgi:hypothetical protein
MRTIHRQTEVDSSGRLRLDVPCDLPPGPVDVILVVEPVRTHPSAKTLRWEDAYGLGKEIWEGIDAQAYVNALRDEWAERQP